MKIALLLEREPFAEIFEETLSRHLSALTGRAQVVSWIGARPRISDLLSERVGLWLCNDRINAIFSVGARSRIFEIPWREYLGGRSLFGVGVRAGYLATATAPLSRWVMASYHVRFRPELDGARSILIIGGRTRLRLIDFERGLVTTVLKSRFDDRSMTRELQFRRSRDDVSAPPIVDVLEGGKAFVEPLIHGTNADRHFDKRRAERALLAALESCFQLSCATREEISVDNWVDTSVTACRTVSHRVGFEGHPAVQDALDLSMLLGKRLARSGSHLGGEVWVGMSHGDLQPGNVLVDGEKDWLIDWEQVGRRLHGYDGLTLALDSRRETSGLLERAESLIRGDPVDSIGQRVRLELNLTDDWHRARFFMLMFFLEEIRFHLEENAVGPLQKPTTGLKNLVRELGLLERNEFWNGI